MLYPTCIFSLRRYGVPFVDYEVQIIKELNNIYFRRADFFIEAHHEYKHETIKVHDELALKHALMTLYSSINCLS